MEIAKIQVSGTRATVLERQPVPTGLIGGHITIEYTDSIWAPLNKTVVFCGNVTRDLVTNDNTVTIPAETVSLPIGQLKVGFYGTDAENTLVIPTVWADLGTIVDAASPSGDESTEPSLPVWAQINAKLEALENRYLTGPVSYVCDKSPDKGGNVPLTASDISALPATGGDMTGPINMNGQSLSGLNPPTQDTEAATKGYVDTAKNEAATHADNAAMAAKNEAIAYTNTQLKKAAPRNLLDNSDFTNPVNQRGYTKWTPEAAPTDGTADPNTYYSFGAGYTIDRWKCDTGNLIVSVEDGYLKIIPLDTHNYVQAVADIEALRGKKVTLALKYSGNLNCVLGYYANGSMSYYNCSKYDGLNIGTVTIPENAEAISIFLQPQDTNECRLYWAALYEGEYTAETLPEYQPKGYGAELRECKRYYQRFSYWQYTTIGLGYEGPAYAFIQLSGEDMRIQNPTMTISAPIQIGSRVYTPTGCDIHNETIIIGVNYDAITTNIGGCYSYCPTAGGCVIEMSADL